MSHHLWKWQWQRRTRAIMLLLLRPDWLRKNQITWQHVTPWSLKECCLLNGQPCRKRPKVLHERDSRAKKHRTQHLLFSRIGDFICHCSGELDPVETPVMIKWTDARMEEVVLTVIYTREQISSSGSGLMIGLSGRNQRTDGKIRSTTCRPY